MPASLIRQLSPEEEELQSKKLELAAIETQIALLQLDLETLTSELQAFTDRYLRAVGMKFAQLDAIEAEIQRLLAERAPDDAEARAAAEEARARAEQSRQETDEARTRPETPEFRPTAEAKDLYRELAKKVHPDLARDEADRERREQRMKAVNQAYHEGDAVRLQQILDELKDELEPVEREEIGAQLVRIIRRIAAAKRRIQELKAELAALRESEASQLRAKVEAARAEGRDLLAEMAAEVEQEIAARQAVLDDLQTGPPGG